MSSNRSETVPEKIRLQIAEGEGNRAVFAIFFKVAGDIGMGSEDA